MDVISIRSSSPSTLNPNAPLFVPMAYRTVEDFSDQWWALVQTSPWFRDYWLQERFHDPETDPLFSDVQDPALPDDLDSFFDDHFRFNDKQEDEVKRYNRELVAVGSAKWRKNQALAQAPRYAEKTPKFVNVRVSPRKIQQPR